MSPRFERGLVIGKFAPLHKGHELLIETALSACETVSVWCYSEPDFHDMPTSVRQDWIRALFPSVTVLPNAPSPPPNDAPDETHRAYVGSVLDTWNVRPDVVFTSEAYGESLAVTLGCEHRMVDGTRKRVPISGTRVRADVHAHRSFLSPLVYAHFVQKVVLLGAESTGKSTLTALLAREFATLGVAEYGREVFERENGVLRPEHFVEIARGHRALEDAALLSPNVHRFLFVDTNALATAMWSFWLTRTCEPDVLRLADECRSRYAHVFVCADDIAFEQDGWRSNTSVRSVQQATVLYDLAARGIPYTVLHGSLKQRLARVHFELVGKSLYRGV
ncbi:AAA family ATPase [Deinococcus yavapaiensis]|uniref:NadR type nicotinamide-nucleotide adenylyltransferase n=1 Tax=Deinococcus yavapaiensis KR-236 TaxID=694435 RepID=A0A318SAH0_9DEIO|nr:AAA family ATPase [Deinococcus yavapaiensis]PYE53528.1 NadR type nicotinamide-nucleotide adenylyltransferase [Deinococcus yavapaiensis KR-236]